MSEVYKITNKILDSVIASNGVQALADRPNLTGQYGTSGLSGVELRRRFDKLSGIIARRINEIIDNLASPDAANYIAVAIDGTDIGTLGDLITSFKTGDFAEKVLKLHPNDGNVNLESLQTIINSIARAITDAKGNIDKNTTSINGVTVRVTNLETDEKRLSQDVNDLKIVVDGIKSGDLNDIITSGDIAEAVTDDKIRNALKGRISLDDIENGESYVRVTSAQCQEWSNKADKNDIPQTTKALTNNSGFITADDVSLDKIGAMSASFSINDKTVDASNNITLTLDDLLPEASSTISQAADDASAAAKSAEAAAASASDAAKSAGAANAAAGEAAKNAVDEAIANGSFSGGTLVADLYFTTSIGYISSGTTYYEGTKIENILIDMVSKEIFPSYDQPSITAVDIYDGEYRASAEYEVGTKIKLSVHATYDDGAYTYNDKVYQENTGANANGGNVKIFDGNDQLKEIDFGKDDISSGTSIIVDANHEYTIGDNTSLKASVFARYDDGDTPKTNKGNSSEENRIPAGQTTTANTPIAIKGYRKIFYGHVSYSDTPTTSAQIRALGHNVKSNASSTNITINSETGAKQFIVAIPKASNKKISQVVLESANNTPITNDYSKKANAVVVEGQNGYSPVEYDVWVYQPENIGIDEVHSITIK